MYQKKNTILLHLLFLRQQFCSTPPCALSWWCWSTFRSWHSPTSVSVTHGFQQKASEEALHKLPLIIHMELVCIWTVEKLISKSDEISIHSSAGIIRERVRGDRDAIGQSDQSSQAGWESLERKAVVWCLISRSPRADGRRASAGVKKHVCVCLSAYEERWNKIEAATDNAVSPTAPSLPASLSHRLGRGKRGCRAEEQRRGDTPLFQVFLLFSLLCPPPLPLPSGIILSGCGRRSWV